MRYPTISPSKADDLVRRLVADQRPAVDAEVSWVGTGDDVDLGAIASTTPGMVGADLANLVNEGASFHEALESYPSVFPPMYVQMCRAHRGRGVILRGCRRRGPSPAGRRCRRRR